MSCGVGRRWGLDPMWLWLWLWLWCRPAATAPIQPLAWELPYAEGVGLKKKLLSPRNGRDSPGAHNLGGLEFSFTHPWPHTPMHRLMAGPWDPGQSQPCWNHQS